MSTDSTDEIKMLVVALDSWWLTTNTNNRKPKMKAIWKPPIRLEYNLSDYVLLYAKPETREPIGIGFPAEKIITKVVIDIRCKDAKNIDGRENFVKYKAEVRRVLAYMDGSSGSSAKPCPWSWIKVNTFTDLSNKMTKMWHGTYDIDLIKYAQTVTKS